ncbi:dof zinc finger protein DOF1.4 [Cucumis sativus]|uniref:Dof zinc finger protein n=1 Tax=Cucumis sativus TaxID=3659 RepID=A0A0A0KI37_CUCSA|nr:dof zinc finger protein DOF1.4 [Cucumis sativus]KGN49238.1 hypothetical protein Csa_004261 [Cucumis sativus]
MASSSRIMDKPHHHQQQQSSSGTLKCPRCDSSNTKFCYYNNYSLSQPRHFCKACKRYWTRGGTLRNVPVGGGCRKNKRLKTSSSSSTSVNANSTSPPSQNPRLLIHNPINSTTVPNIVSSSALNHTNSSMFFGLDSIGGGSGGLGLSSSGLLSHFNDPHQQPFSSNHFHHPTISFDRNSHLLGNIDPNLMTSMKEIKIEDLNRLCQNQTEQIDLSNFSDPSSIYWNSGTTTVTGNWHDPTNYNGSSVASLF